MLKKIILLSGFFSFILTGLSMVYSQTPTQPLDKQPPRSSFTGSYTGRLAIEQHGDAKWLILHRETGHTYLLNGNAVDKLKKILEELGPDNIVTINATFNGKSNVSCEQTYTYVENKKKGRDLQIGAQCIRYYLLEINNIIAAKKSDEKIPEPLREFSEEQKLINSSMKKQPLLQPVMGEIYGTITAVNTVSRIPIKTVEVVNRDKDSKISSIVLMMTTNTRVAKKLDLDQEPVEVTPNSLKVGQEVTVMYSSLESKKEALYITITKE